MNGEICRFCGQQMNKETYSTYRYGFLIHDGCINNGYGPTAQEATAARLEDLAEAPTSYTARKAALSLLDELLHWFRGGTHPRNPQLAYDRVRRLREALSQ